MPRKLKYLFIHCTATPEGMAVTRGDIEKWHLGQNRWSRTGYADMIHQDGTIENLNPYNDDNVVDNWEITNGVFGYNSESRHVVYVGGCAKKKLPGIDRYPFKDTRTKDQKKALANYVIDLLLDHSDIIIVGHNQVANKACPSFNVPRWLKAIKVPKKNIYVAR